MITIPQTTITIQEEVKFTGTEIENIIVMDDLLTYAGISFTFGGKQFSGILWDKNSTPSYDDKYNWLDEDIQERII